MNRPYLPGHSGPFLIHVEDHSVGLVFFEVLIFGGSYDDPVGMEGLADLTALNLLRGTVRRSYGEVMDGFNDLGASVDVASHREYISISGDFMPRYIDSFGALLAEVLASPTFPAAEFRKEKALALEDIRNLVNDDSELARHHFQRYVYGDLPDGRPSSGWYRTVSKLSVGDCRSFYQSHFVTGNVAVVLAGAISASDAAGFVARMMDGLRSGVSAIPPDPGTESAGGGRVLIVDKPGRNQAQVVMGHSSIGWDSPDLFAILTGNTAFGGTFMSRLVGEIREKRGWSYGVSSSLSAGRNGGTLMMRFFPENADVAPAVELAGRMFADCATTGLLSEEIDAARKYLVRQYPFRIETVRKRADELVADLVFDRKPGTMDRFVQIVCEQTPVAVNDALALHFRPEKLATVIVGTSADLRRDLAAVFSEDVIDEIDYRSE